MLNVLQSSKGNILVSNVVKVIILAEALLSNSGTILDVKGVPIGHCIVYIYRRAYSKW